MTRHFDRRLFLAGLTASVAVPAIVAAQPPATSKRPEARPGSTKPLSVTAEEMVAEAGLSGEAAFHVADLSQTQLLEARNPTVPLPPASVAKALTALYALDVLGAEHRFATQVTATGPIEGGVLKGDLILQGGGDPTLQTNDLAELAAAVKATGLRAVEGHFYVWGGALPYAQVIDVLQPPHVGYNPSVSGLALNFNRVHFEWRRDGGRWGVTMDARSGKYRPDVTVARMQVAARDVPVYTYADMGDHDAWTVARGALGNGGARWLPVRKPEAYAAEVFATFARSHGIKLEMGQPLERAPEGRVLVTHKSETLDEILRLMLLYSNNLTAEMVGMSASAIVVSSREAERRRRVTPESVSGSVARREDGAAPPTWPVR